MSASASASASGPISPAIERRRDAVLARLDRGSPPADALPALIADPDPVIRHAALLALRARLADGRPDGPLLPADPADAPPETVALLAELHLLDPRDAPPPADAALPGSVAALWAAARIARSGLLPDLPPGLLIEAMEHIRWPALRDPLPALKAALGHPVTARAAVEGLGLLGRTGRLPAAALVPLLVDALPGPHGDRAAEALAEPWSLAAPLPATSLPATSLPVASLLAALDGPGADAAARALVIRGETERLMRALGEDARPAATHRAILSALGGAEARAVHPLVERALADPPRFGPPVLGTLRAWRWQFEGARIEPRHVAPVVELALASPSVAPDAVATVLDPHAEQAVEALLDRLAEAPARVLAIVAALPRAVSDAALVACAADPAYAALADSLGPALAARSDAPSCAAALRRLLAGTALAHDLDCDLAPPNAPRLAHANALRRGASPDWPSVIARGEVNGAVIAACAAPPPAFTRWATTPGHPLRLPAIAALGRGGGPRCMAALAEGLADEDEAVVEACIAALGAVGRRHPARRSASDGPEASAVVEGIRLALDAEPGPRVLAGLFGRLAEYRHRGVASSIRPHLRHPDVEVRCRAISALAAAVEQTTPWLVSRGLPADHREARALLDALGRRADPAGHPALVLALSLPVMNLKKTAAEALRRAPHPAAIPSLLRWLGRHDNPGFRESLSRALDAAAGASAVGLLRAACDSAAAEGDGQRVERLALAFDGRVPAATLAAWIDEAPWGPRLAGLVFADRVGPSEGSVDSVRRRLADAVDAPPPTADDSRRSAAARARVALKTWRPGEDPAPVLAQLGALGAGPVDALLVDRACAILPHAAAADRTRLVALLVRAPASRRFRAVQSLRAVADDGAIGAIGAMVVLGAQPTDAERPRWRTHADARVRARAALPLDDPGESPAARRRALIAAGRAVDALAAALDGRDDVRAVIDEQHRLWGPRATLRALAAVAEGDRWDPLLRALAGHPLLGALLDLKTPPPGPAAARALARHPTLQGLERLRARRDDPDAVRALARRGAPAAIAACLERGWLGDMRPVGAWAAAIRATPLEQTRLLQLADRAGGALERPVLAALVDRLARAPDGPGAPIALRLRARAFDRVWPHVAPHWRGETAARWLPALPPTRVPPGVIIRAFAAAETAVRPLYVRWFAAAVDEGPLHAPGLRAALLRDPKALDRTGWRLLCALVDSAESRAELVALLRDQLEPEAAARLLLDGLDGQPPAVQIPLLLPWRQTDAALSRLAALWCLGERARRLLPATLTPTLVERALTALEGPARSPAAAKALLTALVETRPDGVDVAAIVAGALEHRDTSVQAHAHRLLRRCTARGRYLIETRRLLVDRHPSVMRRAVRVVCYGEDIGALKRVVPHLHAADRALRESAGDGLIGLGEAALDALYAAHRAARPDRRPAIAAVIDAIEAGEA